VIGDKIKHTIIACKPKEEFLYHLYNINKYM